MSSRAGETRRPPSGAPCHFQDVTRSAKGLKRSCDLRHLPIPFLGQVRTSVVAAAPLPPLVVLGRTSSVVRSLLGEESIVVHRHSLSLKIRPFECPDSRSDLSGRLKTILSDVPLEGADGSVDTRGVDEHLDRQRQAAEQIRNGKECHLPMSQITVRNYIHG